MSWMNSMFICVQFLVYLNFVYLIGLELYHLAAPFVLG